MSLKSLLCLYSLLSTDFSHFSGASIVDFEQVNAGWEITLNPSQTDATLILKPNLT